MNVQVIAAPNGPPLWLSQAMSGRSHDLFAARARGIVPACLTRQIQVPADWAYQGAGAAFRTLYGLTGFQQFNHDHAGLGFQGEWALCRAVVLADPAQGTLLDPAHKPHRPGHSHPHDMRNSE